MAVKSAGVSLLFSIPDKINDEDLKERITKVFFEQLNSTS